MTSPIRNIILLLLSISISSITFGAERPPKRGFFSYLGTFSVGVKHFEMEADQITDAYVETTGLQLVKFQWTLPNFFGFEPDLSYEFTPGDSAKQDELVERSEEATEGWERYVADLTYRWGRDDEWGLKLKYDVQHYLYSVLAGQDYYFVSDTANELLVYGDTLTALTSFKDLEVSFVMKPDDAFQWRMGYFQIKYNKPYTTDFFAGVETIYDTEFSSQGMHLSVNGDTDGGYIYELIYRMGYKGEGNLPGGLQLSDIDEDFYYQSSYADLEYTEYEIGLGYDFGKQNKKFDLAVRANYSVRSFNQFLSSEKINDDKLFSFVLDYKF